MAQGTIYRIDRSSPKNTEVYKILEHIFIEIEADPNDENDEGREQLFRAEDYFAVPSRVVSDGLVPPTYSLITPTVETPTPTDDRNLSTDEIDELAPLIIDERFPEGDIEDRLMGSESEFNTIPSFENEETRVEPGVAASLDGGPLSTWNALQGSEDGVTCEAAIRSLLTLDFDEYSMTIAPPHTPVQLSNEEREVYLTLYERNLSAIVRGLEEDEEEEEKERDTPIDPPSETSIDPPSEPSKKEKTLRQTLRRPLRCRRCKCKSRNEGTQTENTGARGKYTEKRQTKGKKKANTSGKKLRAKNKFTFEPEEPTYTPASSFSESPAEPTYTPASPFSESPAEPTYTPASPFLVGSPFETESPPSTPITISEELPPTPSSPSPPIDQQDPSQPSTSASWSEIDRDDNLTLPLTERETQRLRRRPPMVVISDSE